MTGEATAPWYVVHVEDDRDTLRQVKEYLEGETFDFGSVSVFGTDDFGTALDRLRERRVDLLVLDVFRGDLAARDSAGTEILTTWRATGFAPVILHTALPETVKDQAGPFVRIVPKEAGGLKQLGDTLRQIFAARIPQIHRAAVDHLAGALRSYMWGFVTDNWEEIRGLTEQPDFVRLLLKRLGLQFTHGVAGLIRTLYPGADASDPAGDTVHPVEYYVRPPIGPHPQLGDLRRLPVGTETEVLMVVVWPSCDLVHRDGRCKVSRVLCARAKALTEFEEYSTWTAQATPGKDKEKAEKALTALIGNNRRIGQAERYYFLPAAWDMPPAVVDFNDLEHVPVEVLNAAQCVATVASPFAEAMAARLIRYLGRLGTPDLDMAIVLKSLRPEA